jgi:uncharacterized protein (DUF4415 family)
MSISDKRMAELKQLADRPDEAVDFSDIAELDENFWKNARLVEPEKSEHVTLRVKKSVVDAFKAQGKGHTSRMSAVLESYARAMLKQGGAGG